MKAYITQASMHITQIQNTSSATWFPCCVLFLLACLSHSQHHGLQRCLSQLQISWDTYQPGDLVTVLPQQQGVQSTQTPDKVPGRFHRLHLALCFCGYIVINNTGKLNLLFTKAIPSATAWTFYVLKESAQENTIL